MALPILNWTIETFIWLIVCPSKDFLFVKDACVSTEDGFEDIEDEEEENEEEEKCRFPVLKT